MGYLFSTQIFCFLLFISVFMINIFPVEMNQMVPFIFNISNFKPFHFECGGVQCVGFLQYCELIDHYSNDGVCKACREDLCLYPSRVPQQCQVMCKMLGYLQDSEKLQVVDKSLTLNCSTTNHLPNESELETTPDYWRMLCIIQFAVNVILLMIVLYTKYCNERIKQTIKSCIERRRERAFPTVITSPSDCNGETDQLQENSEQITDV